MNIRTYPSFCKVNNTGFHVDHSHTTGVAKGAMQDGYLQHMWRYTKPPDVSAMMVANVSFVMLTIICGQSFEVAISHLSRSHPMDDLIVHWESAVTVLCMGSTKP